MESNGGRTESVTIRASAIRSPGTGYVFSAAIMTWNANPEMGAFVADILPGGGERQNYVSSDDGVMFIARRCLDRLLIPCCVTLLTDVDFTAGLRTLKIAMEHSVPTKQEIKILREMKMRRAVAAQLSEAIGFRTKAHQDRFFVRRVSMAESLSQDEDKTFTKIHSYLHECRDRPPIAL